MDAIRQDVVERMIERMPEHWQAVHTEEGERFGSVKHRKGSQSFSEGIPAQHGHTDAMKPETIVQDGMYSRK